MCPDANLIDKLLVGDRCRAATDPQLSREFLADTIDLAERYARIEKLVLGSVRVAYSPTSLAVDLAPGGDAVAQGEALATAERARLELPAGAILDFEELIEAQGIKIIPRLFPSPTYAGGFFFDAELGPCILVHARASDSAVRYGLAHEYAHFLADFDPYITTLCGMPAAGALSRREEIRAHHMALEFLMPRADIESYRRAMGLRAGAAVPADLVRQLGVYFDLDAEVIFWRLLDLKWIDAAGLGRMLEAETGMADTLRGPPALHGVLPERFVRLVAGAFGRGKIDLEEAATYLGTDLEGVEGVLAQFDFGAESGKEPAHARIAPAPQGGGAAIRLKGNGSGNKDAGPDEVGPRRVH